MTDMSGDGAEREAAVSDIERKVDAFRAEQEKAAQKQMETIRQAEDSKIQKLSDALGKLRLAPADRPGLRRAWCCECRICACISEVSTL